MDRFRCCCRKHYVRHHHCRQPAQTRLAGRDAGLDIIGDGEQARQQLVQGFVEHVNGLDFAHMVPMGIRNNRYEAMALQVVAAIGLAARVHALEARLLRAHTVCVRRLMEEGERCAPTGAAPCGT